MTQNLKVGWYGGIPIQGWRASTPHPPSLPASTKMHTCNQRSELDGPCQIAGVTEELVRMERWGGSLLTMALPQAPIRASRSEPHSKGKFPG